MKIRDIYCYVLLIYMYMQNDEGVANNCFNLDCGGFVHTGNDKHFALGGSFFPDSQVGGDLFTVTFGIHRVRT